MQTHGMLPMVDAPITLAQAINDLMLQLCDAHAGTDYPIFDRVLEFVCHNVEPGEPILGSPLHDWYDGNILHAIVNLAFVTSSHALENDFPCLSRAQMHNALNCCFKLISSGRCDPGFQDYYQDTPFTLCEKLIKDSKRDFPVLMYGVPRELHSMIPDFMYLFRHGKNLRLMQNFLVRRFLHRKRRQWAVRVIEDRFLECMLSPYTAIGRRMMRKRARHFYDTARLLEVPSDVTIIAV